MPRRAATADGVAVQPEGAVADRLGERPASPTSPPRSQPAMCSIMPSKVMFSSCSPCSALVAGVKIGSGSRSLSRRPGGQRDPADRAARLVFLPARSGEVAADDGLDRDDVCRPADHHPAAQRVERADVGRRVAARLGRRPRRSPPGRAGRCRAGGWARSRRSRRTRTATGRSGPGPCRGSSTAGRRRRR